MLKKLDIFWAPNYFTSEILNPDKNLQLSLTVIGIGYWIFGHAIKTLMGYF